MSVAPASSKENLTNKDSGIEPFYSFNGLSLVVGNNSIAKLVKGEVDLTKAPDQINDITDIVESFATRSPKPVQLNREGYVYCTLPSSENLPFKLPFGDNTADVVLAPGSGDRKLHIPEEFILKTFDGIKENYKIMANTIIDLINAHVIFPDGHKVGMCVCPVKVTEDLPVKLAA